MTGSSNYTIDDNIRGYLMDFENLPYGIAVVKNDAFLTLIQANSAYHKLIGYTKEELFEKHQNHIKSILVDNIRKEDMKKTNGRDFEVEFDLRILTIDQEIRWIHGFADYSVEMDAFFLAVSDISDKLIATARHLSYNAFQIRNEILGYLNIYTNEHITVTDVNTDEVMYMNPSASKLLGFTEESDWLGKPYCDIAFGSKEDVPESYYEPVDEEDFTEGEFFNEFHKRYFNIKSKIIMCSKLNRKIRLNIITDITAEKQLEFRVEMRNTLQNCIATLFEITAEDTTETVFYDVLKKIRTYYEADAAFFYEFANGTYHVEKIYRLLKNGIKEDNFKYPIIVDKKQIDLLQELSYVTIEESEFALEKYNELYQKSVEQFHIDYEVKQFSCVAINDNTGKIIAFIGVTNPRMKEDSKELIHLLSRFVCMFMEHQRDQRMNDEALSLEASSKANIIEKCAKNFQNTDHAKEKITDSLEALCGHYDADCAMVIYENKDSDSLGIPYVGGTKIPDISTFQKQPRYSMEKWEKTFKENSQFVTDEQLNAPVAKEILKKQYGIYNFIASPIRDTEGVLVGLLFVNNFKFKNRSHLIAHVVAKNISDYLEKVKLEEKIQLEPATRLANKVTTQSKIATLLEQEKKGTLFIIDIDKFRQLNDILGYHMGDQAIVDISNSLKSIFGTKDVIGRVGGDEFMVFSTELVLSDLIERKASEILKKCHNYYNKNGVTIGISVSIGICTVDSRSKTFQPLYENADYALHIAKKSGKNRYHVYSEAEYLSDTSVANELRFYPNVVEKIKSAIHNEDFVVHYQPLFHIPSGTFDQAEALVRIEKQDSTLIYPNDFIHVAESSGLAVEMTYQILEQICKDFRQILDDQPDTQLKSIAINVPYLQFIDPHMENRFMDILGKYNIAPSQIKLEITERIIIKDMDLMISKMNSLRERGFDFELDDFGTDYSNLQMCITLPLEVVKLDRGLLLSALKTNKGRVFFEHVVEGLHCTDRHTIMEGVETQEQLEWATQLHCEYIQGYYFSKPLGIEDFAKFLKK